MAALRVGAELRLVDGDEGDVALHRHRFRCAEEPARVLRDDFLLAGDQRDLLFALELDDPVVNLARQQTQRKADHPARMRSEEHTSELQSLMRISYAVFCL